MIQRLTPQEEQAMKVIWLLGETNFDNSYKDMVNFFVEQERLSPTELKEIIALIEKSKKS